MDLRDLQRHWHAFGEQDPLWAILTDPTRKGGRWTPEEFFATGVAEITGFIDDARAFGLPAARRRALDFGCGVGRLTQALADHADAVVGLDVAPSMIAHAERYNRHGARVQYRVQAEPPLDSVASRSIDLVYTGRVLQHIDPEFSRAYIRELARVVAPGGFLSFDVPGRWLDTPAMPGGALAPGAYRAALDVVVHDDGRGHVRADVTVMNTSPVPWPAGIAINAGNRWLTRDGAVVIADDQRAPVRLPLGPGQLTRLSLTIPRPMASTAEVLEIDLVHEDVTWFGWQGSTPIRLDPRTGRAHDPAGATPAGSDAERRFEPVMEMHAVPRPEVEAMLHASGVTLLRVRPEAHCGPNWEAWRYDVTAGPGR